MKKGSLFITDFFRNRSFVWWTFFWFTLFILFFFSGFAWVLHLVDKRVKASQLKGTSTSATSIVPTTNITMEMMSNPAGTKRHISISRLDSSFSLPMMEKEIVLAVKVSGGFRHDSASNMVNT